MTRAFLSTLTDAERLKALRQRIAERATAILKRFAPRRGEAASAAPATKPARRPRPCPVPTAAEGERALARLQKQALAVYERHGLPTKPGHYIRSPGDGKWRPIPKAETPQDRFAAVLRRPPDEGWRYAALADLGRKTYPDRPDVRLASDILEIVHGWRTRFQADAETGLSTSAEAFASVLKLAETDAALRDMASPGKATTVEPRLKLQPAERKRPAPR